MQHNLPIMRAWAGSLGALVTFREPRAGALCLMRYHSAAPSCIVPGAHLGLEGFIRVWLGGKPEFLTEGLRRIGEEPRKEPAHA